MAGCSHAFRECGEIVAALAPRATGPARLRRPVRHASIGFSISSVSPESRQILPIHWWNPPMPDRRDIAASDSLIERNSNPIQQLPTNADIASAESARCLLRCRAPRRPDKCLPMQLPCPNEAGRAATIDGARRSIGQPD